MFYATAFFSVLLWVSLIGLIVNFGFQLWYTIKDFKDKTLL